MTKAWELQGLVEGLKGQGLDVAEKGAVVVINAVLDWVEQSVTLSPNKYDDAVKMFTPMIRQFALNEAGKIAK